jgi:hypothetical protein
MQGVGTTPYKFDTPHHYFIIPHNGRNYGIEIDPHIWRWREEMSIPMGFEFRCRAAGDELRRHEHMKSVI